MAFCNPVRIGFGWAQDVRVDGTLPGDRFRATFSPSLGGPSVVLPDVEPLANGRLCLRMDGSVTAGFAPGAYAWELLLIRGQASAVIAGLPPLEAEVPASAPVPESNPLAGPSGVPLRASITGEQPEAIAVSLRMELAGPAGPPGPQGQTAGIFHAQTAPAATWTIAHSLGRSPAVTLFTPQGEVFGADVYASATSVTVIHGMPMSGSALLT